MCEKKCPVMCLVAGVAGIVRLVVSVSNGNDQHIFLLAKEWKTLRRSCVVLRPTEAIAQLAYKIQIIRHCE